MIVTNALTNVPLDIEGHDRDGMGMDLIKVDNHLYGQYLDAMAEGGGESNKYRKFDETVKKIRKNFYETKEVKFLLREKLVAVEMDHSYAGNNSQCFDGMMGSDIGKSVENNEFEEENDESI